MVFKNLLEIFLTSINGVRVIKGLAFPSWPFVTLTYLHSLFELFPFRRNIFGAEMSKSHGNCNKSQPQLTQHFSPHDKDSNKADASSVATDKAEGTDAWLFVIMLVREAPETLYWILALNWTDLTTVWGQCQHRVPSPLLYTFTDTSRKSECSYGQRKYRASPPRVILQGSLLYKDGIPLGLIYPAQ